jgi:S-DNA-T family DNA segregation ATPase FtsK/SpoIIIE
VIEVLAFPLVLVAAAMFPKMKNNDKKTIRMLFENTHYGIRKGGELEIPVLKKKEPIMDGKDEIGTTYVYSLPVGLKGGNVEPDLFSEALGKPVEVEYKRGKGLSVHVYNQDVRTLIPFKEVPEPPMVEVKGKEEQERWVVPLGKGLKGWLWHNFDHVPHMTVAGTTRFGKTVLLRLIMTYLIMHQPDDVEFYIIDLKGKLEFNRYRNLKQVKWIAGTPAEALDMLTHLTNEELTKEAPFLGVLEREMEYYEANYISNITETNIKKRRFIIVDEGAQLAPNNFTSDKVVKILCQDKLSRISAVGGALGMRLIFGTQYPTSKTLSPNVKMNSDAKISFRLPAGYASEVAIDEYGAEKLPSNQKGRALMKTHELKEMQVPFITHAEAWKELERYQDPFKVEGEPDNVISYQSEIDPTGGNSQYPRPSEVRHKGANPDDSFFRNL